MCQICERARASATYQDALSDWLGRSMGRVQRTQELAQENDALKQALWAGVSWPPTIKLPLFEARAAYAVPTNYYQNFFVDGERQGNDWAHDYTRAVAFYKESLFFISQRVKVKGGQDYFGHLVVLLLGPEEYSFKAEENGSVLLSASLEKEVENLVTGEREMKKFSFHFTHKPAAHAMVSREQALSSGRMQEIYGNIDKNTFADANLEGYLVTVPHFAPHPYLSAEYRSFGYGSRADFQAHVDDYFKQHARK